MATPDELNPTSSFRRIMLFSAYAAPITCMLAAILLMTSTLSHERGLAEKLLRNAIRNSGHYLDQRDTRGVIESVSDSLDFVYFEMTHDGAKQAIGEKSWLSVCATDEALGIRFQLCRNPDNAVFYILLVLSLCSGLGLFLVLLLRRLETAILKDINLAIQDFQQNQTPSGAIETALIRLRALVRSHRLATEERILLAKSDERATLQRQLLHDLKSPIMALEIVAQSDGTDIQGLRSLVGKSIERLNSLIKKLKAEGTDDSSNFSLSDLENQLIISGSALSASGYEFVRDRLPSVQVLGDAERIARILDNLIKNSLEAMKDAKTHAGEVKLQCQSVGSYEVISVTDNGPGFKPEILEQLEVGLGASGSPGGEGIGIVSARSYLRKVQGDLKITSRPGETRIALFLKRT